MSEKTKSPADRLLELIRLEKKDLITLPFLVFAYGVISIATPVSVQALVNVVNMGAVLQPLFVISLILFVLLLLSGALYVFEGFIVELIQRRIYIRTAINTAQNTQKVEISLYDKENPVELINRFFDVDTIQKSAATLLTISLISLLQVIIGSIILLFYSVYFAFVVMMIIGFLIFIVRSLGRHATETAMAESKAKYEMASWLESIAKNIFAFKFYKGNERTANQTQALVKSYIEKRSKHFNILLWQNITAAIIYAVGGTALLAIGGGLVIRGEINLGQFVAAELIIFGVLAGLVRLVSKLDYFYDLLAALDKIGVLEDVPQEKSGEHIPHQTKLNSLKLNDVHFAYNHYIKPLSNIKLDLQKGQNIAVLGSPGSGKSTLLKLIAKFRSPSAGQITINEIDLRQIENDALRDSMGLAGPIEILEGTIKDNICLERQIDLEKLNTVLRELGLEKEFSLFPQGIDTVITASGAPLSSSQLQRLMIARALAGSPSLLLIDGLLDSFNENELNAAINLFNNHHDEWMLIVTTRFVHIAKRFDTILDLNQSALNHA
ncbi:SunT ABC-type bacteriocin/lantibiotic exporters, contain an N-terminal double-glycine peptidase domain [Methylophilaceae bacterium]